MVSRTQPNNASKLYFDFVFVFGSVIFGFARRAVRLASEISVRFGSEIFPCVWANSLAASSESFVVPKIVSS